MSRPTKQAPAGVIMGLAALLMLMGIGASSWMSIYASDASPAGGRPDLTTDSPEQPLSIPSPEGTKVYLPIVSRQNSPTPTPTATPTASPTMTPTPLSEFEAYEVGCAAFPQESSPGWYWQGCLTDGTYEIQRINVSYTQAWSLAGSPQRRFAIEADARLVQGSADYRIFFNSWYRGFYVFGVNPDNGAYAVWRVDQQTTWFPLIDWTSSPHIKPGNEVNRLRVARDEDQISVFVNGQFLAAVSDSLYITGTDWGLYTRNSVPDSILHFSRIMLERPRPPTPTPTPTPTPLPILVSGVAAISAGEDHTCALTKTGGAKCWGDNYYGQVGDGTKWNFRTTPVDVVGLGSGVAAISAGRGHTCALTTAGGVKCWGDNWAGQLGNNTNEDSTTPVDVVGLGSGVAAISTGHNHTCALTMTGGVKCWGSNYDGQLGDGTEMNEQAAPVDVLGLGSTVAAVSAGGDHTCALTTASGVKCWGSNSYGQLGDGTKIDRIMPADVSGLTNGAAAVEAGAEHTCARTTVGGVRCWGHNDAGRLGDGSETDRSAPVNVVGLDGGVVAVTAGGSHTCALTPPGGAKCWGHNADGQLGVSLKHSNYSTTPVDVVVVGSDVAAISAGDRYTCALISAGDVKCWGYYSGQP